MRLEGEADRSGCAAGVAEAPGRRTLPPKARAAFAYFLHPTATFTLEEPGYLATWLVLVCHSYFLFQLRQL